MISFTPQILQKNINNHSAQKPSAEKTTIKNGFVSLPKYQSPKANSQTTPKLTYNHKICNDLHYMPQKLDLIPFGAMKKSEFQDADLVCINKFVAPIEKFNSRNDLEKFAEEKLKKEYYNKEFPARTPKANESREILLKQWKERLTEENWSWGYPGNLIIMAALTKNLKPNNDTLPLPFNENVLLKTMSSINTDSNRNYTFNFEKQYAYNYKLLTLSQADLNNKGWIKIPSLKNDEENFPKNVDKLKVLSHKDWCTASYKAEEYLSKGDMYIYMEESKPKAAIRMINNKIQEIQGVENSDMIPWLYVDAIENFIKDNDLNYDLDIEEKIIDAKGVEEKITKIKTDLSSAIENNEDTKIFEYLKYKYTEEADGSLTLDTYKQPSELFTFSDLGIDETKLLSRVKKIKNDAYFQCSPLKTCPFEEIGGTAMFAYSDIRDLGNLKSVGQNANFVFTKLKSLGNLEKVGGHLSLLETEINDTGNLKYIGGNLYPNNYKLSSLNNIEYIGGSVYFEHTNIKEFPKLKYLGGANFKNSKFTSLGPIEHIGGNVIFRNSNINDLGNLKVVGGVINIKDSKLTKEDFKNVEVEFFSDEI